MQLQESRRLRRIFGLAFVFCAVVAVVSLIGADRGPANEGGLLEEMIALIAAVVGLGALIGFCVCGIHVFAVTHREKRVRKEARDTSLDRRADIAIRRARIRAEIENNKWSDPPP